MILAVALFLFGIYTWGYKPLMYEKNNIAKEVEELRKEYNSLMAKQMNKEEILEDIEVFQGQIQSYNQVFTNNLSQEKIITILNEMETKTKIKFKGIAFSPEETILAGDEDRNEKAIRVGITVAYEGNYGALKDLLKYIKESQERMVIDTMTVGTSNESNILTGNLAFSFYGLISDGREVDKISVLDIPLGKNQILETYGDVPNNQSLTNSPLDANYDFFVLLSPITADLPTVVIGKSDDTSESSYINVDENRVVPITIELSQEGEVYYYRYQIAGVSYPTNYVPLAFKPEGILELRVLSNPRVSEEDNSGVNATIINATDKLLKIVVNNEDAERPRFNIIKEEGEIVLPLVGDPYEKP